MKKEQIKYAKEFIEHLLSKDKSVLHEELEDCFGLHAEEAAKALYYSIGFSRRVIFTKDSQPHREVYYKDMVGVTNLGSIKSTLAVTDYDGQLVVYFKPKGGPWVKSINVELSQWDRWVSNIPDNCPVVKGFFSGMSSEVKKAAAEYSKNLGKNSD